MHCLAAENARTAGTTGSRHIKSSRGSTGSTSTQTAAHTRRAAHCTCQTPLTYFLHASSGRVSQSMHFCSSRARALPLLHREGPRRDAAAVAPVQVLFAFASSFRLPQLMCTLQAHHTGHPRYCLQNDIRVHV
jgi:hypothetical protein